MTPITPKPRLLSAGSTLLCTMLVSTVIFSTVIFSAAIFSTVIFSAVIFSTAAFAESPIEVAMIAPEPGEAVFGDTAIEVEIYPAGAPVARVEFYMDGFLVGEVDQPPYRLTFDAGQDNVAHRFEAVAYPPEGEPASASTSSRPIVSDAEIDVELMQLYITATDRSGERVLGLDRDDFQIVDSNVPQRMITFERGDAPFTAVILLDASDSMAGGNLDVALAGVRSFLRGMRTLDEAKLILFSDRVLLETPFTNITSLLSLGLESVEARGGSAINDALYLSLKRVEARQGRKVVVLLSDGIDVDSALRIRRINSVAQAHQAALYWLRLPRAGSGFVTAWRTVEEHRVELDGLAETIVGSGGRIELLSGISEVETAFRQLLAELREQYVLGYYPSQTRGAGSWHPVEVITPRPEIEIRARGGYREGS